MRRFGAVSAESLPEAHFIVFAHEKVGVVTQPKKKIRYCMGGDHCHNSTRARFSYSGRAISYSGRAVSYSGRAISYSGRAVSYLGGAISYLGDAISLQLRNSTLGKNVVTAPLQT